MIQNVLTVLFLVFLEGMLSFDNAIVLAVLVKNLPEPLQKKAFTYGIWGAMGFRALALGCLTVLMQAAWVKLVGALYLLYLAGKHFLVDDDDGPAKTATATFWKTILLVEATDIAFSSDSILASVAVTTNYWVVLAGGLLGIIMMRFAAILFIRLVKLFPNLERTAYLLITIVGGKLLGESIVGPGHVNEYWLWSLIGAAIASGFLPAKEEVCSDGH